MSRQSPQFRFRRSPFSTQRDLDTIPRLKSIRFDRRMERRDEQILRFDCCETRSDWIDDLLVERPDGIPFEVGNGLRRTLNKHVLSQSVDRHSSPSNTYSTPSVSLLDRRRRKKKLTSNGRESRIVPSSHITSINEPFQFPLRQKRMDKVDSSAEPVPPSARRRRDEKERTDPKSQTSTFRNLSESSIH